MSGIQYKMQQRIVRKFRMAGAISKENAVTYKEANLNDAELQWLNYFAGEFLGKIKKTKQHRYYVRK